MNSLILQDKSCPTSCGCFNTAEATRALVHQHKYLCYTYNSTACFWHYQMHYIQLKASVFSHWTILNIHVNAEIVVDAFYTKLWENCFESQFPISENILSIIKQKKKKFWKKKKCSLWSSLTRKITRAFTQNLQLNTGFRTTWSR